MPNEINPGLLLLQDFDGAFVDAMELVFEEFKERVRFYSEGKTRCWLFKDDYP